VAAQRWFPMLVQAAGLAFLAAVSPAALLVAAIYLGSARPRVTVLAYLAGAVVTATALGVVVLVLLRSGHFDLHSNRQPRYGLRLGLGLLTIAAAVVVARRRRRVPKRAKEKQGLVSRLAASPAPATAFLTGVLVFGPSMTFIAAVQVVATAHASAALTAAGLAVVVVIDVVFVWLPILAFLAAPEATARHLAAFNGWLRAHGRVILTAALAIAGVLLTVNGLTGLIR
jgi:hypothetical protein